MAKGFTAATIAFFADLLNRSTLSAADPNLEAVAAQIGQARRELADQEPVE